MPAPRPVITVEDLRKVYLIGHKTKGPGEETLRESVTRGVRNYLRTAAAMLQGRQILAGDEVEEFTALKGVSFEVAHGEVLGVIGRNGAGKSTLLKVLSRITEPTEGRVTINGRVASLLEVGTGFHPELTGRENIYLNGAILGMTRAETRAKFDEIVDFAGVERFLDTPVKRYSSGMYVRLAFAVAAHLEPEILIVDEVLAVGDAQFQKKCLGKMTEVAGQGRTVLFVSHNLQAVERLCTRAIVLNMGEMVFSGGVSEACRFYTASAQGWDPKNRLKDNPRQGSGEIRFTDVEVMDDDGKPISQVAAGESFTLRISYVAHEPVRNPFFGFALLSDNGVRIFNSAYTDTNPNIEVVHGAGSFDVRVENLVLAVGHFRCNVSVADQLGRYYDYLTELPLLDSLSSSALPSTRSYDQGASGMIFAEIKWNIRHLARIRQDNELH